MKKITNEIKAKYYNQYQFSHVCFEGISNSIWTVGVSTVFGYYITNGDRGKIDMDNVSALELTSLEQISDNDAIEVAKYLNWGRDIIKRRLEGDLQPHQNLDILKKEYVKIGRKSIDIFRGISVDSVITSPLEILNCAQYLQSKGYALPYQDYSIEYLVHLGVIKLK